MHLGIDASRAVGRRRTGTENYSLQIICALLKIDRENEYTLYTGADADESVFGGDSAASVRVLRSRYLWTHGRLSWEMLRRSPDVLFVPAHVLPVYRGCPSVVTIHDLGYLRFPEAHRPLSRWHLRWGTAYSAHAAKRVIAVSAATKQDLIDRLGLSPAKISVVPEACPPGFEPLADPEVGQVIAGEYGLNPPYIVTVGTVHPRKNVTRLLQAFAAARKRNRLPHQLALIGQPGWRSDVIQSLIAELGLADAVIMTGYVPDEHLPSLLGAAEALVFPSLYEGFGLPVLEAMACRVPVIAANASSLPEVVGDAGLLVDPLDVDELAEAIGRLLGDERLREDLAERGYARARTFSWERAARDTLAVLTAAVGSS
ncbi:MAG: glycosyltransferase family 1 protein [Dehalococcoidales bacterium]|nr:glycosyltransferase family 1 protein [Dehalococcoidales bacterium]